MKGKHRIVVSTKRQKYEFELRRNLTILRGDSATGKTTLIEMIQDHENDPLGSPVELISDKKCYVLEGALWKEQLAGITDSIVFIDEGNTFVKAEEFAGVIQNTDNYYVIVSRESLPALPYSVEEIYGIRTSGKYGTLKQIYHEFYRIYNLDETKGEIEPEAVVTEDSNSGYQFFDAVCRENGLTCETLNGKSNIFRYLKVHKNEKILVIADGAAFGSEMDRVMRLMESRKNIVLYLPESFEWLILSAGVLKNAAMEKILKNPSEYVESRNYFSWERFFTALLIEETKGTYLAYFKRNLNPVYLNESIKTAILSQMKKIKIERKKCVPFSRIVPLSTYMMQEEFLIVERRCAMMKEVRPFSSSFKPFCRMISVSVSILEVASSRIRIFGSARSARAKEISWRCPADRRLPRSFTCV